MNGRRLLILLLLLLPVSHLTGQEFTENDFDRYTTAQGLSHNTVRHLAQDSTGYIWITTPSGLDRFDGRQFVQYHSTNDSVSLPSEELRGMAWLNKDLLAIYTTGVHILNTKTGEQRNLFIPYHRKQLQYKFNAVWHVMGDEDSSIYVLTTSGFYHFDKKYNLISRFDYYTEAEVPVAYFVFGRELFVLDKERLLIVAIDGFYIYEKKKRKLRKMTAHDCPLLTPFDYPKDFYTFFQPKPGQLFIFKAYSDSLFYINFDENKQVISRLPFNPGKNGFHWRSRLARARDTLFYVSAHENGFYKMRFYPETGKVQLYPHLYFGDHQCLGMLVDREQKLWVATTKGLYRQDEGRSQVAVSSLPAAVEKAYPNTVFNALFTTKDKLIVGTLSPGNLLVYDKKSLQFIRMVSLDPFRKKIGDDYSYNIYHIESINPSMLIMAANGPPLIADKEGLRLRMMSLSQWGKVGWTADVFRDSKGYIWIGTTDVFRYNPENGTVTVIPENVLIKNGVEVPTIIQEDGEGNIWMTRNGLSRYNILQGRFDLRLDSFPFIKMPDKQVRAMVIDKKQNTIWIASNNNGLLSYNIAQKSFRHFTTADGLPDNNLNTLMIVGNRLWMAGATSLACLELHSLKITGFGKADGFPDMSILSRSNFFYDSAEQELYVAFAKVIARFNPDRLLPKKSPPHVFIESLVIDGEKNFFHPHQNITTSWTNNEIRVTIGSINFSDCNSQGFSYRILKDSSTQWQQLGSQPSFSISNLSPGVHRIQVKCFSLNNRWPEQVKEISIAVLPPFWLKDWFIISLIVVVMVFAYLLIQWRINMIRKKEKEKTHIQKLKADDYKNQFELEQISNYFSSSLSGKKTEEEVLWDVTNNLMGRMTYEDCVIYLWNEDKTKMVQKAAYGPKGKPEIISANVFEVEPGQGIVGHVMQTRQPLLVDDTRLDSRYRVDDEFRLSEVSVPIIHNNELMGVLDSEHHLPKYFSERDIKILTTIATLIGNKLKQIESEQSLEAKRKELVSINEQLAEARLSALQAQMNPHFVFNALNSIKRMILDEDNKTASRYLSKFALMIRMTLEHSKEIFVTVDQNIEYLKAYLEMEQLRFDDSFTYSIFTGENIDTAETVIPSLMIQPLVENAIWHGLMQSKSDKKVMIAFTQNENKITCTIEDNGIGIRQSERLKEINNPLHRSTGLENLQKRIKIINEKYDIDCSLEITDLKCTGKDKRGTRVVLRFNIINT